MRYPNVFVDYINQMQLIAYLCKYAVVDVSIMRAHLPPDYTGECTYMDVLELLNRRVYQYGYVNDCLASGTSWTGMADFPTGQFNLDELVTLKLYPEYTQRSPHVLVIKDEKLMWYRATPEITKALEVQILAAKCKM